MEEAKEKYEEQKKVVKEVEKTAKVDVASYWLYYQIEHSNDFVLKIDFKRRWKRILRSEDVCFGGE